MRFFRLNEPFIHVIKAETMEGQTLKVIKDLHFSPVRLIKFCSQLDLVITTDEEGCVEVWDPETYGNYFIPLIHSIDFPSDN